MSGIFSRLATLFQSVPLSAGDDSAIDLSLCQTSTPIKNPSMPTIDDGNLGGQAGPDPNAGGNRGHAHAMETDNDKIELSRAEYEELQALKAAKGNDKGTRDRLLANQQPAPLRGRNMEDMDARCKGILSTVKANGHDVEKYSLSHAALLQTGFFKDTTETLLSAEDPDTIFGFGSEPPLATVL